MTEDLQLKIKVLEQALLMSAKDVDCGCCDLVVSCRSSGKDRCNELPMHYIKKAKKENNLERKTNEN